MHNSLDCRFHSFFYVNFSSPPNMTLIFNNHLSSVSVRKTMGKRKGSERERGKRSSARRKFGRAEKAGLGGRICRLNAQFQKSLRPDL
jgi:hypothetical protein